MASCFKGIRYTALLSAPCSSPPPLDRPFVGLTFTPHTEDGGIICVYVFILILSETNNYIIIFKANMIPPKYVSLSSWSVCSVTLSKRIRGILFSSPLVPTNECGLCVNNDPSSSSFSSLPSVAVQLLRWGKRQCT